MRGEAALRGHVHHEQHRAAKIGELLRAPSIVASSKSWIVLVFAMGSFLRRGRNIADPGHASPGAFQPGS